VAVVLRARLRRSDAVARLGGDEFAVLLLNVSPDEAALLAEEIGTSVAAAGRTDADARVGVAASVGVALLDEHVTGLDDAMLRADTAMYDVKVTRKERATVSMSLEPAAAPAVREVALDRAARAGEGPTLRVLHCDDSEPYRRLIAAMLEVHEDIEVVGAAASGEEGLIAIGDCRPDVVLLDADRLGGSTDRLVTALRIRTPDARIIVLSSLEHEQSPGAAAVDGFVSKSAAFDEIADAIRRSRPRRELSASGARSGAAAC